MCNVLETNIIYTTPCRLETLSNEQTIHQWIVVDTTFELPKTFILTQSFDFFITLWHTHISNPKTSSFDESIKNDYFEWHDIWHLLLRRGITLWTIWIEKNHMVFNQSSYLISKVKYTIYVIEWSLTIWSHTRLWLFANNVIYNSLSSKVIYVV